MQVVTEKQREKEREREGKWPPFFFFLLASPPLLGIATHKWGCTLPSCSVLTGVTIDLAMQWGGVCVCVCVFVSQNHTVFIFFFFF